MILPKFAYKKVGSLSDVIALYKGQEGKVLYLAGGTDLMPLIKQRLVLPDLVVDLKGAEELRAVTVTGGVLSIGANVSLFNLKSHPLVRERLGALHQSLDATSCETLQMRGTIGGNILQNTRCLFYNKSLEWRTARGSCFKTGGTVCNAVPGGQVCFANYCSDNASALIALSAEARLHGPEGERTTKLEDLFTRNGVMPFALKPGEVLVDIQVPLKETKSGYEKLRVRDSIDYPLAGAAVSLKGGAGRVCVGGIGPAPLVYDLKGLGDHEVEEAARRAYSDAKTVSNAVLTPGYRKKMAAVLVRRAIRKALEEVK